MGKSKNHDSPAARSDQQARITWAVKGFLSVAKLMAGCVGAILKKTGAAVRKKEEHKRHDKPCPKLTIGS